MKIRDIKIITNFETSSGRLRQEREILLSRTPVKKHSFFPSRDLIPQKYSQLYSKSSGENRLVCSFAKGKIALLNPQAQEIFDLCDGKKKIAIIWKILSQKRTGFTFKDAWNLRKRKISFKQAYQNLKRGKTILAYQELLRVLLFLNRTSLIKILELPYKLAKQPRKQTLLEVYFYLDKNSPFDYPCPRRTLTQMSREIGLKAIDSIFNLARKNEVDKIFIKFFTSQPERFSLVKELFSYCKKKSVKNAIEVTPFLFANWQLINSNFIKDIRQMELKLIFPLDGIGQVHDKQSEFLGRKGSFKEAKSALGLLQKEKYPFFIIITITSLNLDGLKELTSYLLSKKIHFVFNFIQKTPWLPKELFPDQGKLKEIMLDVYDIIDKKNPAQYLFSNILINDFSFFQKPKSILLSCCQKEDLLEIKKIESDPKPTINCQTCQFREFCLDKHRMIVSYYSSQQNDIFDYCEFYRSFIPEALEIKAEKLISYKNKWRT